MAEQVGARQFHESTGVDDWRVLNDGAYAYFITGTFAGGVALINEISRLADEMNHHPDIDLRYAGVTVRLWTHDCDGLSELDIELARKISALARARQLSTDSSAVQTVQIAIDALDIPGTREFWRALLAYRQKEPDALVDEHGRGPTVWFQATHDVRSQRGRVHVDLYVPHDQLEARISSALDAGGHLVSDEFAPRWWVLGDVEGNEACIATFTEGHSQPDVVS
ncbi:MAG: 4a-hydroxytetrahydrobiopterin dehydratase [Acidimicrobiales bacterium]